MNNPVTLLPVYDGKGAAKTWLRLRVLVEMVRIWIFITCRFLNSLAGGGRDQLCIPGVG